MISPKQRKRIHYKKSLIPTSKELLKLNLKHGLNELKFQAQDGKKFITS